MPPWFHRPSLAPTRALAATFAVMAVVSGLGLWLTRTTDDMPTIWLTGGVLLGILIIAPARQRLALAAAGLAGQTLVKIVLGNSSVEMLSLVLPFAAGLLLAAGAMRRDQEPVPDLTRPGILLKFALVAGLLVPAAIALVGALLHVALTGAAFSPTIGKWFPAYALGLALMAPLTISILQGEMLPLFRGPGAMYRASLLLAYCLLLTVVFGVKTVPLLFLPMPLLLLVVARLGGPGTSLAILLTGLVALVATLHGRGPFLVPLGFDLRQRLFFLQVFLAVMAGTAFPFAAIVAERRRAIGELIAQHARTSQSERQYRLLADNSSDIIACIGIDGERRYVSPAVQDVLGWTVPEMMVPDWRHLIHPDDLPSLLAARDRISSGMTRATSTARFRRKDDSWCWLETRMHQVCDEQGRPDEMVCNLRDVSRQKAAEARLDALLAELAEQAATDPLTGVANRRRFEEAFEREWGAAARDRTPIGILMIDADRFKAFNDRYGHHAGDECLRAIADCLVGQTRRPVDLVARYGGEEFVVILPRTSCLEAIAIGERVRAAVEAMELPHAANSGGVVTISIGAAAVVPEFDDHRKSSLMETADTALYQAKRAGRNRVEPSAPAIAELAPTVWQAVA